MIRLIVFFSLFVLPAAFAQKASVPETYIVVERYSKRVLFASGSEYRRPIGSVSNVVVAKIVMDWMQAAKVQKTDVITVPYYSYVNQANPLGLQGGDTMTLRDALYATILGDGSVVPMALAYHVGKDLQRRRGMVGDPLPLFVAEMNHFANRYGMRSTSFYSPSGADFSRRLNQSTASDLARLALKLASDSALGFYTKQKQRVVKVSKRGGAQKSFTVRNSNPLLSSAYRVSGIKSGGSSAALKCGMFTADKNAYSVKLPTGGERITPVQLVVVVLGSKDLNSFAGSVIPQGWRQYAQWRKNGYLTSKDRREFLVTP